MAARVNWYGPRVMAAIRKECSRRVRRATGELERQVVRNLRQSRRVASYGRAAGASSLPGEFPRTDRGILGRAIFSDMIEELTGIVGVDAASPAAKYAKRLENGGIIQSHGKFMAVPISPEAIAHSRSGGPRTFGRPLTMIRRRGKVPLLVEISTTPTGRQSKKPWIIHYVLTPKVTIEQRSFLARTAREMQGRIAEIFSEPFNLN